MVHQVSTGRGESTPQFEAPTTTPTAQGFQPIEEQAELDRIIASRLRRQNIQHQAKAKALHAHINALEQEVTALAVALTTDERTPE